MSRPLLSPRHDNVANAPDPAGPTVALASRFPPGTSVSVVPLFVLAGWLAASPMLFGYQQHPQAISDWVSAGTIATLALATAFSRRPWVSWLAGCVGLWVLFAPVVLWSPTFAAYATDGIVGSAVVTYGALVPMGRRLPGGETPRGWSYNPSAWSQRAPVIVLSAASFVIAAYLAAFQLGHVGRVWDPVFGTGTERVLTSELSRSFPISDAALGAATYLIDLLMTCAGDARRWRTMPWLVLLFGILIVPVGAVSIALVVLQPVAVGAWCSWCLITATATLAMIPLAIDEVAATLQLLRRVHHAGGSWWSVLWRGEAHGGVDVPVAPLATRAHPPGTLAVIAAAGVWTMIAPAVLGVSGPAAISDYCAGAAVIVIAVTAASEIARPLRLCSLPVGIWIVAAPWILEGSTDPARLVALATGLIIVAASLPRGMIGDRRAALDRIALWPPRLSRT